jgi:hypothetical protein
MFTTAVAVIGAGFIRHSTAPLCDEGAKVVMLEAAKNP